MTRAVNAARQQPSDYKIRHDVGGSFRVDSALCRSDAMEKPRPRQTEDSMAVSRPMVH